MGVNRPGLLQEFSVVASNYDLVHAYRNWDKGLRSVDGKAPVGGGGVRYRR